MTIDREPNQALACTEGEPAGIDPAGSGLASPHVSVAGSKTIVTGRPRAPEADDWLATTRIFAAPDAGSVKVIASWRTGAAGPFAVVVTDQFWPSELCRTSGEPVPPVVRKR